MATWNDGYEAVPGGNSTLAGGDDAIRSLKEEVRLRLVKEHEFSTEAADTGRQGIHKAGSAIPYVSETKPTARPDGTSFEEDDDYDLNRLWLQPSTGRMYYIQSVTGTVASWAPVGMSTVGEILWLAYGAVSVDERLLPCDGQTIANTGNSLDGSENGYANLVSKLLAEAAGDPRHPYTVVGNINLANVPDLRGVGIRGMSDLSTAGSEKAVSTLDENTRYYKEDKEDVAAASICCSFQDDYILDHNHPIEHSHGADMDGTTLATFTGHDTASAPGRTGVLDGDWTLGKVTFDDTFGGGETNNWLAEQSEGVGSNYFTTEGLLSVVGDGSERCGMGSEHGADNWRANVDLEHWHTIPTFHGLSGLLSEHIEEGSTAFGLPEVEITYGDEVTAKNKALYPFIRY